MGPITQHSGTAEVHFFASVDLGQDGVALGHILAVSGSGQPLLIHAVPADGREPRRDSGTCRIRRGRDQGGRGQGG